MVEYEKGGLKITSKFWAWTTTKYLLTCGGTDLVEEDLKSVLNFGCFELSDNTSEVLNWITHPDVQKKVWAEDFNLRVVAWYLKPLERDSQDQSFENLSKNWMLWHSPPGDEKESNLYVGPSKAKKTKRLW